MWKAFEKDRRGRRGLVGLYKLPTGGREGGGEEDGSFEVILRLRLFEVPLSREGGHRGLPLPPFRKQKQNFAFNPNSSVKISAQCMYM